MEHWWERGIVEAGKLPLLTALAAFIATFVLTRLVTRMIRAGRGPFRNVSAGGTHVHHVVPGVLLMVIGGFGAVAAGLEGPVAVAVAAVFGTGVGLVLDEFALILHLDDVYWSEQGRKSVELVVITGALVMLFLAGFLPFGIDDLSQDERQDRGLLITTLLWHFACSLVALAKGKPRLALFGVLVPLMSLVAAIRLARPGSPWARRLYRRRPRALARAERRAERHDRRWVGARRKLQDIVGGTPNR